MKRGSLVGSSSRQAPPVALAVVSWNTRELLRACLESIAPEVTIGRAEAWVVDNASADGSAELVTSEFPWVRLIASRDNLGFGAAVNLVAAQTSSPWLAVANADTELLPGALATLLATGERELRAGIIAPRLTLESGETQHSVHRFPTLPFALAFNIGAGVLGRRSGERMLLEGRWRGERAGPVDWAIGAFLLVRRSAWEQAGGFDPDQWMYAEDLDLGWRFAARGWTTYFEPAAAIRHHGAAATTQLWGGDLDARWIRSTYAWMLRRRGPAVTRAYALINTAGAAVRAVLYAAPSIAIGGAWTERERSMRRWTWLHLRNLLASRASLESHR
jgi:N-acetylglucosaminyl-diphospho-decaprenol L-rhamnosyltransferase